MLALRRSPYSQHERQTKKAMAFALIVHFALCVVHFVSNLAFVLPAARGVLSCGTALKAFMQRFMVVFAQRPCSAGE